MNKHAVTCLAMALSLCARAQKIEYSLHTSPAISYSKLYNGFAQPPAANRLRCYWWWLNSMVTKESITRDLEQMKLNGYGGASIVDAGSSNYTVAKKTVAGPVFMSPAWMELYKHAIREAQRLGIELSVNTQSGWNPGGPTITPELALKKMVFTDTSIVGGKTVAIALAQPETILMYQDIAVQAFREEPGTPVKDKAIKNWSVKSFTRSFGSSGIYPLYRLREEYDNADTLKVIRKTEIIDLTAKYKNGVLAWDPPPGNWTIVRYGWTCTGAITSTNSDGWSGLSVDHLSPAAFKKFSDDVILPLITAAQAAGNSLHFLQTDSWEMGTVGWTNDFANEFRKFRGYDIFSFLPVLAGRVVESLDQSDRFLHDYRLTIGDCVASNHYQLFSDLAHAHGLGFHPESGGPHSAPVDALKVMAISDFPQGEFWAVANTHRVKDAERLAVKQSASAAHTNGKRFVAAEGPTSIGPQWERYPRDLKANIDRVFCSGVNRIVWHTFTSSPKEFGLPGNEYFAGTHLNPNVTWWKEAKAFISYLNRCSFMLAQGLFNADALYYYGDDVPNFVFLKEEVRGLKPGYDWDKCSKQALSTAFVKNRQLYFPDGMHYRVLVLPAETAIDAAVLRKVELLVKEGLTVIGPRPLQANSLSNFPFNDAAVAEIAENMWAGIDGVKIKEHVYGKGKVVDGKDVNTVLQEMEVLPDFSFSSTADSTQVDYIHRSCDSMEIYFLSNRFGRKGINDFEYRYLTSLPDRYEQVECRFRVAGMEPELWDAVTGKSEKIVVYKEENGQTIIPLFFEPEASKFIVFRKKAAGPHIISIQKDGEAFFPGNHFSTADNPYIDIGETGKNVSAAIFEPGNYAFQWSDGKNCNEKLPAPNESIAIAGKWDIYFDTSRGGPAHVQTDTLQSWIRFNDPAIKYYAGRARYKKVFSIAANLTGKKAILDLGKVWEMGAITLNGHAMPVKWMPPFRFDITPYIKAGKNELLVEVVNGWPNRLIGDAKLPAEQRSTKTNIIKYEGPDAEKLLRESGLAGPVSIRLVKLAALKQ